MISSPPQPSPRLADFEYALPPERIAQKPASPRDHARLMVLDRKNPEIAHRRFYQIGECLKPGDVLVINATRVFPARLRGRKSTGGKAELLLLRPLTPSLSPGRGSQGEGDWVALARSAMAPGVMIHFPGDLTATLEENLENGEWRVHFSRPDVRDVLERFGEMPLPPYIKRAEKDPLDAETYQTVFAREDGSIAAPTAGFHFTPELLTALRAKGVIPVEIVLHVGWGTFRPVRAEQIADHRMLPEYYEVRPEAAASLNAARHEGRRIVAVGTTSVRTLESIYQEGTFQPGSAATNLFIYPGYAFRAVDALITNFHLPDSTPLLLACAFYGGAEPFSLRRPYDTAIREGYRFYSYGDAMFIQ